MGLIRILFLADTHLGFDLPFRPRVERPRRGPDFFNNFRTALEPALRGEADAVIHGGDLLFRSRVPARLVDMALEPLKAVADAGVPVFLVPGNHERSRIPYGVLSRHPNLHIFDRPRTFSLMVGRLNLALAGFPYVRDGIRRRFPEVLEATGWREAAAACDAVMLCLHHCFESARVGPQNHTFRTAADVARHADVPPGITAVLSGHIHRGQALRQDLQGKRLATPILYPGSVERTSFAEREEIKGYLWLKLRGGGPGIAPRLTWEFVRLPTRPMVRLEIAVDGVGPEALTHRIREGLAGLEPRAVVQLRVKGRVTDAARPVLRAAALRAMAPPDTIVQLALDRHHKDRGADRHHEERSDEVIS